MTAKRRTPVTFLLTPLVLGASGRIGQSLRFRWGEHSAVWQRRERGDLWGRKERLFDPLVDLMALEAAASDVGQILCLAGPVPGPRVDLQNHVRLAEASVRVAAKYGVRVILASSAAVYGAQSGLLNEDLPLFPTTPYGQAKADMEARALMLGRDLDVSITCLRIGNIAGFDAILGGWRPGFRLDRFADGRTPIRSYIGPVTLADVIATLLQASDLPEVLNISQPNPIEMGTLLQAAGRAYTTVPAPEAAIAEVVLDVSRLTAFLSGKMDLALADPAEMIAELSFLKKNTKDWPTDDLG